ncbi:MAG: cupin domain-containing protein [Cyclobacteriaceae bacterium]|jgi:quercetin dioxygenase-like cupin family protein|nr:cupin domain-containing protein [Cyclobacteriaceae bacterium]
MSDEISSDSPFIPEESVEYAAQSVVSKTILKRPGGTITLFAFDQGEGLSEHSTPHEALVQLLDGEAEIMIGGKKYVLQKGESIFMPANVPHALRAVVRFKMMLVMIRNQ